MKIRFIINPYAGRRIASEKVPTLVKDFIAGHRLNAEVVITERPGHAIDLAADAVKDGCELVVACGGDGTVNEVAQRLTGTRVEFGIVPCGSGNGLANYLRIPRGTRAALEVLLTDRSQLIDTGLADGNFFVNVMGIGFDASIANHFNRSKRRGAYSYFQVGLRTFLTFSPTLYQVTTDGQIERLQAWLITVANSDQYGNNAIIAPAAKIDDGKLNLVAVRPFRLWNLPGLIRRLFNRSLDQHPAVTNRSGSYFLIERPEPGLIHTDGEPHVAGPKVEVRIVENSLRIKTPRASQTRDGKPLQEILRTDEPCAEEQAFAKRDNTK